MSRSSYACAFADFTADREFHPALKMYVVLCYVTYYNGNCNKMQYLLMNGLKIGTKIVPFFALGISAYQPPLQGRCRTT